MSKRILIGKNTKGKTGLWISKPGFEAGDITKPHIFSCENSYLEVLSAGRSKMEVRSMNAEEWEYYWSLNYPAQPHIPLCFITVNIDVSSSSDTVYFPAKKNYDFRAVPEVSNTRARVYEAPVPVNRDAWVTWIIFKNKMLDT